MRKKDKIKNMLKANLLNETRFLESKEYPKLDLSGVNTKNLNFTYKKMSQSYDLITGDVILNEIHRTDNGLQFVVRIDTKLLDGNMNLVLQYVYNKTSEGSGSTFKLQPDHVNFYDVVSSDLTGPFIRLQKELDSICENYN